MQDQSSAASSQTLLQCGVQADLENTLQVNEKLQTAQAAAHRELLFVQDRIAKYQAGCERVKAQNQILQMHILTLAAVGTMSYAT